VTSDDLSLLAERFVRGFNALDRDEQRLARNLYRSLGRGRPVAVEELANEASVPASSVADTLRAWPDIHWGEDGSIRAYLGLTVEPTRHQVDFDEGTAYTWCAWDSLFIPGIAATPARVRSTCPASGVPISLRVHSGGVEEASPADTALSFIAPQESQLGETVTANFCQFVHFLSLDRPETDGWLKARPELFVLSLDEAFTLGALVNARRFETTA